MARYKLVEYLNDPSLLLSTSLEELNAWAEEAPYSGLIRRLIAQKVAIENTTDSVKEKANALAILSNANPEHVISSIEDFKKMILEQEEEALLEKKPDQGIQSDEDNDESMDDRSSEEIVEESSYTEDVAPAEITEEIIEFGLEESSDNEASISSIVDQRLNDDIDPGIEEDDIEDDEFYSWLTTLKPLTEPTADRDMELADKELASEGLAELLVRQGHYKSAIEMYELLKLKNPEKSSFFAAQIETLKAL